ncbi:unnamed protein product [Caenorhabditis brenneri]
MIAPILLISFLFHFSGGCLIIGYSEPPPCNCQMLPMTSKNIYDHINEESFKLFFNVTTAVIKAPVVSIDDCSGAMYCEGDYNLYVFDTDKEQFLGEYGADAICQPFSQSWLVDDGTGAGFQKYKQLKGVCVLRSTCPCSYVLLDNSNGFDYLKNNTYYNTTLKYHPFKPAMTTVNETTGCQKTRSCEDGWEIRVFVDSGRTRNPATWAYHDSNCEQRSGLWYWYMRQWWPTVLQIDGAVWMSPICVDFSTTIDPGH